MITSLIFDFDGVLGCSRELAWDSGADILRVFGQDVPIRSMAEHRAVFGRAAQEQLVGAAAAETLCEMHRLAMRQKGGKIPPYRELLQVLSRCRCPMAIITAGYAATASSCLGQDAHMFRFIRGRESGSKTTLLKECRTGVFDRPLYVCDTVRDIRRCKEAGLPVCATAWQHAYDNRADLARESPRWLVGDLHELTQVLSQLRLLHE